VKSYAGGRGDGSFGLLLAVDMPAFFDIGGDMEDVRFVAMPFRSTGEMGAALLGYKGYT
jgi:hypothetical protein